jgi:hypothetical protein
MCCDTLPPSALREDDNAAETPRQPAVRDDSWVAVVDCWRVVGLVKTSDAEEVA